MTNWLADPVACAIRLKKESGCTILAGRNEVMSRTTLVNREEKPKGAMYRWGHLFVRVDGKPGEVRQFVPGTSDGSGNEAGHMRLSAEHANVMSDLLRAAYVNAGGSNCGGKTLYEMIWDEMMVVTDRLMSDVEADQESDPDDVGAARSLAWVIAVMQNPYLPNVDAVREQVMERWDAMDHEPAPGQLTEKENRLRERRMSRRARRRG